MCKEVVNTHSTYDYILQLWGKKLAIDAFTGRIHRSAEMLLELNLAHGPGFAGCSCSIFSVKILM